MQRIKTTEVKAHRDEQIASQFGVCAVCGDQVTESTAVLDHCHTTGLLRGVLHRGCNAMLGRLENNAPRDGLRGLRLARFLRGAYAYLNNPPMQGRELLHPTHRSEDEKRVRRNLKAKQARAKRKA